MAISSHAHLYNRASTRVLRLSARLGKYQVGKDKFMESSHRILHNQYSFPLSLGTDLQTLCGCMFLLPDRFRRHADCVSNPHHIHLHSLVMGCAHILILHTVPCAVMLIRHEM